MNANEMTYGVELEVFVPATVQIQVGGYHNGMQVAGLPTGWNAQGDCSIQADPGYRGVEIVSPVLRGADGLKQIQKVCCWLSSIGAKVNRSTGCHVHVGFAGNDTDLAVLTGLVAYHETALFAVTGSKARMSSRYCKPIRTSTEHQGVANKTLNGTRDRYHTLNLNNLTTCGRAPTVEFRMFAGTCNALKVIGYVRMCLALVEKAHEMRRLPKWTPTENEKNMNRLGAHAVKRFFACFGWTKGKTPYVYGAVIDETLPTVEACKTKLMEMARKFDVVTE